VLYLKEGGRSRRCPASPRTRRGSEGYGKKPPFIWEKIRGRTSRKGEKDGKTAYPLTARGGGKKSPEKRECRCSGKGGKWSSREKKQRKGRSPGENIGRHQKRCRRSRLKEKEKKKHGNDQLYF